MESDQTLIGELARSLSQEFRLLAELEGVKVYAFLAGPSHWFFRHVYSENRPDKPSLYEAEVIYNFLCDEHDWSDEDICHRHCDPYLASLEYLNRWAIAHDSHYAYVCDQLAEDQKDLYKVYDIAYGIWISDLESGVQYALIEYCRTFGAEPYEPCPQSLLVTDGEIVVVS